MQVPRDRILGGWRFDDPGLGDDYNWGCGYPSDKDTQRWMKANFDPIFGWHEGREAIRGFLERAMAGLADREFRDVWHVADGERLVIYWRCDAADGAFESDDLELYHGTSTLLYAGNGLWKEQVDIYDREQARSSRTRAGGDAGQSTT